MKRQVVNNWLSAKHEPSASNLVRLMREFDVVSEEVLKLAGKRSITDAQVDAARRALKILEGG